ncbi:MAG: NUDIX hydrolase [Thermodesulfovibrionales bacterium]|nr:NUDIX hydrolase [Thermodesulfovibrionales bacterium]
MKPASIVHRFSAGGVVFRRGGAGIEVALISVRDGDVWTLPKGLVDGKEKTGKSALREVREETGIHARIIGEVGESHYWYNIRSENQKCRKTVKFYLMEFIRGDMADHDEEVDEAAWFPIESAGGELTYKGDRAILEKAKVMIEKRIAKLKAKSG